MTASCSASHRCDTFERNPSRPPISASPEELTEVGRVRHGTKDRLVTLLTRAEVVRLPLLG
jgi:hypothetical protein